ncbi:hypothetical protein BDW59DRAFT_161061 [Aspergillus cavernicola]|uniref:Integral membrane protein n=1 Tax=Aspergillus cavernicola TaxID=176166 RepID=A0ABR4IEQ3_9EURO
MSSLMMDPRAYDIMLRVLAFVCWSLSYINTVRTTVKDQLPSVSFMSICCDVAWEFVYAFIYPIASSHWAGGIRVWFVMHCAMMLIIIKYAPNEWVHVPFMKRHPGLAYLAITTGFMAGEVALAGEVGPDLGFFWGGALCQITASLGSLCQLVSRGSTRGASINTCYFRIIATVGGFTKMTIRHHWHLADEPWFDSPLCWFYIGITLTLDAIYPAFFFYFRRSEHSKKNERKVE